MVPSECASHALSAGEGALCWTGGGNDSANLGHTGITIYFDKLLMGFQLRDTTILRLLAA